MAKRVLVSSLTGVAVLGGVAAGGLAMASTATEPTLENGSARYVAPSDGSTGSLILTADVRDDSGVRGLKVVTWPASSKLEPTEAELRHTDDATCRSTSNDTSRCTHTLKVTKREAGEPAQGTWYVSALAVAKDGDTVFVPRAATFDVRD
ncbi:DUF5707 domain-containing protein [Streptomyces sp. NEAU-W12]|uniref:DUF5707 domain-containing protein n=1 Tax=Streptomyces sp. NEAU-W12 TaxID=2994668 RepID=UPI00224AFE5F|nr:DUF5707 domain-containing protein [Streptomyces sp. NEAU-W12]MCX2925130.1 DUF5707 domain-containing protein [Streptomyces sp. NEAU-W12]